MGTTSLPLPNHQSRHPDSDSIDVYRSSKTDFKIDVPMVHSTLLLIVDTKNSLNLVHIRKRSATTWQTKSWGSLIHQESVCILPRIPISTVNQNLIFSITPTDSCKWRTCNNDNLRRSCMSLPEWSPVRKGMCIFIWCLVADTSNDDKNSQTNASNNMEMSSKRVASGRMCHKWIVNSASIIDEPWNEWMIPFLLPHYGMLECFCNMSAQLLRPYPYQGHWRTRKASVILPKSIRHRRSSSTSHARGVEFLPTVLRSNG